MLAGAIFDTRDAKQPAKILCRNFHRSGRRGAAQRGLPADAADAQVWPEGNPVMTDGFTMLG